MKIVVDDFRERTESAPTSDDHAFLGLDRSATFEANVVADDELTGRFRMEFDWCNSAIDDDATPDSDSPAAMNVHSPVHHDILEDLLAAPEPSASRDAARRCQERGKVHAVGHYFALGGSAARN
jgi:hypothetical protein